MDLSQQVPYLCHYTRGLGLDIQEELPLLFTLDHDAPDRVHADSPPTLLITAGLLDKSGRLL